MNDAKYIGMDVHTATISAAVRDSSGNLVTEATGRFASRCVCGARQIRQRATWSTKGSVHLTFGGCCRH